MKKHTLIVAPHPDDEILGCGGTLLRRKSEGAKLAWLIVTNLTEVDGWSKDKIETRKKEIKSVAKKIGFDHVYHLPYPAIGLDRIPMSELVGSFSKIFKEFEPEELFLPHRGDSHSDHRVVFDATAACTKWFRYPSIKSVLAYETASETEFGLSKEMLFKPNYFIDISDYLNTKLEILKIYESEIGEHPFPRSIDSLEALAKWRGSNSGYKAAEAFELLYNRN